MAKLTIDVPDKWVDQVQSAGQSLEAILLDMLAQYVDNELPPAHDFTKTRTWELCGSLSMTSSDLNERSDLEEEGAEDGHASTVTNYAEQVDNVLYNGF